MDYGSANHDSVFLVTTSHDFHWPVDNYFHFDTCNNEKIRIVMTGLIVDSLVPDFEKFIILRLGNTLAKLGKMFFVSVGLKVIALLYFLSLGQKLLD
jgi:hypothetical protein